MDTVSPRPVLTAPSPEPAAEPVYRTPKEAIDTLFEMWDLGPDSVLLDIGCGEGDVLIAAAKRFGCQCIGIEIDKTRADTARKKRKAAGLDQNQVTIICGDARANGAIYSGATHVFAYLHGHDLKDVIDLIPETALMVTYHFGVPGRSHRITRRGHTFHLIER